MPHFREKLRRYLVGKLIAPGPTVTFNPATGVCTGLHGRETGDWVTFSGALPPELSPDVRYCLRVLSPSTFRLYATREAAEADSAPITYGAPATGVATIDRTLCKRRVYDSRPKVFTEDLLPAIDVRTLDDLFEGEHSETANLQVTLASLMVVSASTDQWALVADQVFQQILRLIPFHADGLTNHGLYYDSATPYFGQESQLPTVMLDIQYKAGWVYEAPSGGDAVPATNWSMYIDYDLKDPADPPGDTSLEAQDRLTITSP